MVSQLKHLIKSGLRILTGVVHPARRHRARRLVTSCVPVHSVLILCLGNVCRSPYAKASLVTKVTEGGLSVRVDSAGFIGPGRAPPAHAQEVAIERALELAEHRSKVVSSTLASSADLIVVMEPRQVAALRRSIGRSGGVVVLGDLDPLPVTRRSIPDPWGQEVDAFRHAFDRIDRCLEEMVKLMGGETTSPPEGSP